MATDVDDFVKLSEKAEELKTTKIRLEEQCKNSEKALSELVAEIKKLGYEPNELKKIIAEKEKQLESDMADFQKAMEKASNELSVIEGN